MKIKSIRSYEVLDSRGYPTVACEIIATNGMKAKAMVPSGASTGEREAIELRDNDKKRYMGKGVLKAVENVNKIIAPYLIKKNINIEDQNAIDKEMIKLDGTNNKNKFGANAILSVSMAITKLGALIKNKPLYKYINEDVAKLNSKTYILPLPMLNVINGGAHADNTIDFQEFMFIPVGAKNIRQACQISSECFHNLAKLLKTKGFNTSKGDEGGFAPLLKNADEALSFMTDAIKLAGYKPGVKADVAIAMDTACSELYDDVNKKYFFEKALKANIIDKKNGIKTTDEMIEYLDKLTKKYPIISIEDGLAENDWDGWIKYTKKCGATLQIVGDDIYCTNPKIVTDGIKKKASNSVLIKLNQIGTVTETIETIKLAQKNGWTCVVSHRSGETEDTFIADLAVGMNTGQIKTGSMSRSERIAKYNRLMEIEDELKNNGKFIGIKSFNIKI